MDSEAGRVELLPCPKCKFKWTCPPREACHHTADCSEFIVICPRCKRTGELKATRELAIQDWNERDLRADNGLREALEPFAKAAEIKLCGEFRDDEHFGRTDIQFHLTFGDLRRAARALQPNTGERDDA